MNEVLDYLGEDNKQIIEKWASYLEPQLGPLKERHRVDLVIEGGVGSDKFMAHLARRLFPDALWVGTELCPELVRVISTNQQRFSGCIDGPTLQEIQRINQFPDFTMKGAIIYGNCFDYSLVKDVAKRAGSVAPLLASFNALPALLDIKKKEPDRRSVKDVVSLSSPFVGQFHIQEWSLWSEDPPRDCIQNAYCSLEKAALQTGWTTKRIDSGLLLVRQAQAPLT